MARFVYHPRLRGVVLPLIGVGVMIAFRVLAIHTSDPNRYVFSLGILAFTAATTMALALSRLIDGGTRRVREVVSLVTKKGDVKKTLEVPAVQRQAVKTHFEEMAWETGPGGRWLLPCWLGTLGFLGLAACIFTSTIGTSRTGDSAEELCSTSFGVVFALLALHTWATLARFRINGQIVTIERPYALFGREVSFDLNEIDQVDVTHRPHDQTSGKGLTITLQDGRKIEYNEADEIIDAVERQLRLAIERSHPGPHPLSDEAVR